MSRRLRSLLLLASLAAVTPVAVPPAGAEWIAAGCTFRAVRDPNDPQDKLWFELTTSYFIGTPDVTIFAVTCWLQTSPTYTTDEIQNTRHTCSDLSSQGVCSNPVLFEVDADEFVYECVHIEWTDTGNDTLSTGHLLTTSSGIFSTGLLPIGGSTRHHTQTFDDEPLIPGVQCPVALVT